MAALIVISLLALAGAGPGFATLHLQLAASYWPLNAEPRGELNIPGHIEPQKDFHPIRRCDDPGATGHRQWPQDTGNNAAYQPRHAPASGNELGVLLLVSNDHDHDGAIDTRRLRRCDEFVDQSAQQ